ncbi:hypothetical protein kac65v162_gp101 [Nodularia phage vB_NspS-kac65v162]|uniref:Uncharacterized protein n=5 Tax=Ravarandavirus TaxID=2843444 RepID=A0A482MJY2_9CAUD|nr:hypothetical protein HWC12_gp101 [Nodularia phage vB_NspS-kac65v151]YP_009844912.1 hypothetical protein HWC13_gp103 [Nodularia phage vB_NspS-kac68v161]QBQ73339.1 hypothetical protein kac65v161_gp101 [Nodularia phage vB_NspS-kac65v161]QBQ73545.1 hypothetical protein kac65v162_gp101 [Nodularia phage vB_NspS-kac65v162]QBQ73949.1 hypothetical protein kac68v162_gp101 [Nodularia phage vB_NspS-kac68v162]QBQ73131.1 hypothetical protein kac65v151_gp101 [Nodularia phage vB_NspS-kac65v151]QBQ73753.1 
MVTDDLFSRFFSSLYTGLGLFAPAPSALTTYHFAF